jgi:hypothetical protein
MRSGLRIVVFSFDVPDFVRTTERNLENWSIQQSRAVLALSVSINDFLLTSLDARPNRFDIWRGLEARMMNRFPRLQMSNPVDI